jgi:hypothetical protein
VEIFSNNTDAEGSLSLSIKDLVLQMQRNDANSPIFVGVFIETAEAIQVTTVPVYP